MNGHPYLTVLLIFLVFVALKVMWIWIAVRGGIDFLIFVPMGLVAAVLLYAGFADMLVYGIVLFAGNELLGKLEKKIGADTDVSAFWRKKRVKGQEDEKP